MGGCTIDRFATAANKCCKLFNSYFWEEGTHGVDAFAQGDWAEHTNYCNPPLSQISRLCKFLQGFKPNLPRCIVVAPKWMSQPWYQQLLALSDSAYLLPHRADLFVEVPGGIPQQPYLKNSNWRMVAFVIGMQPLVPPSLTPLGN